VLSPVEAVRTRPRSWPASIVRPPGEEADQRLGSIDILVNNAGVIEPIGALVQSDPAAWRRSIEVNLLGAYHTAHATLPRMLEAGKGTVINISSGAAHRPLEGWSAYCSAKAGLAGGASRRSHPLSLHLCRR
jgi:NAD(P)-dependent dehydrogenase (short-subunit alcohol dehydrogenase family)